MKKLVVVLLALSVLLIAAAPAAATPLSKAMSVDRPLPRAVTYAPRQAIPGERATEPYPEIHGLLELATILTRIDKSRAPGSASSSSPPRPAGIRCGW